MLKILVDENFDNTIVRGLFRRNPMLDMVRVQDVGLSGKDDPTVLEWAAQEGRILLTHDVATITRYAYDKKNENKLLLLQQNMVLTIYEFLVLLHGEKQMKKAISIY
jgi:predicted nuclease of predicted toxin-antitoxin system